MTQSECAEFKPLADSAESLVEATRRASRILSSPMAQLNDFRARRSMEILGACLGSRDTR